MSGTDITKSKSITLDEQITKRIRKDETDSRKEADKGTKHFNDMSSGINGAIAAMESGDNGLADTMMGQVLSQVQDSNVRAFQMYNEFDKSYGDFATRVGNSISRFVTGSRTPEEKQEIKNKKYGKSS